MDPRMDFSVISVLKKIEFDLKCIFLKLSYYTPSSHIITYTMVMCGAYITDGITVALSDGIMKNT